MIAEILSTGDEVCSGAVIDTNAAHIAAALMDAGAPVARHLCVGDDLKVISETLADMGNRADVAVITGGLGPTVDDLTAEAAALAARVHLKQDEAALESIRLFFAQFGRKMAASDAKQAMLPQGAEAIPNPVGTAPGFVMTIGRCRCYFLPGVPREMIRLLSDFVLPDIRGLGPGDKDIVLQRALSIFGLPEAKVNDRLAGFGKLFPTLKLGMLARFPVILVKLTGQCKEGTAEPSGLMDMLGQAENWAVSRLGETVFDRRGRSMEAVVGELLASRSQTLAVAESCTGGLVAHLLTNVPGSSAYFMFSGVTYANQAKMAVLGVLSDTLSRFGAVHEETVKQMAEGARRAGGADWGLATSGIAGPSGGTPEKPVGVVCVGIASSAGVLGFRFQSPFQDRLMNKSLFAVWALDTLRRQLIQGETS